MYLPRLLSQRLRSAAEAMPAVVLVGARQVGKSTLLQHVFPEATVVTFDPIQDIGQARADPDLFLRSQPRPLILDEIQYVPELVAALKRAIDADRQPGRFLVIGSQEWQVMSRLSESLAGRAVILDLEGFAVGELDGSATAWLPTWLDQPGQPPLAARSTPVGFIEQLWRGFLPEAQRIPLDLMGDFHRSYRTTYIERDVRLLADLKDWSLFGRFVRLVAALTAQEINKAQIGRELGIQQQTALKWLDMLRATFQWHELEPWHGNTVKRLSRKGKGYGADSGQICEALAIPSPQALLDHPAFGAIVETALVGDLRRQTRCMATRPQLYHWRTHGGAEVDLVIGYNGRMHPIEIKAHSHPGRSAMRGIHAWRATYPAHAEDAALVIAPVERGYQLDPTCWVVPWNAT